ncbi:MAG TPA: FUSC family protein [Dermatophilaceae bacterium]|nr:FUSC family protein [Dermatophilaceae bacterium]
MTSPIDRWRSRGASLAPRAARRSQASMRHRFARLHQRSFFIVQCASAAAVAWWVATNLLHHESAFFAPVTVMLSLGMSYGQRLRRVIEVTLGVAIGVLVGDIFVHLFGTGAWQIAVVATMAMTIAVLFGAGTMLVTQAGVQAIIVTTLVAQQEFALSRWLDAVVGGTIALLAATITPASPLRKPRAQAAVVVTELSSILTCTAKALRQSDLALAGMALDRARRSEHALDELRDLSAEGIAVVRLSPFRRRHLPGVQAIADLLEPLDRAIRNIRVLVRRASVAVRTGEEVPAPYVDLISSLAEVTAEIADQLGERRLATGSRAALTTIAQSSSPVDPRTSLSAEVIRAQVRSVVVDLLMLTGLTYVEACARVPAPPDGLADDFDESDA